ncbi:hypothetical protein AWZ03_001767 [Drosophila navojoa]|uniref:Uncharacterized protein n=1 Tax=Drosophila navojoa TaxID=7232 RepID=A0A484BSF4_DRONA|nr:hypothetical protein AWZ03_001767 [Drosophila navojoa]
MSSFNSPDILMPLDEYYDQCVVPKPRIPKHYGFHVEKRQRQAARLQSYRDNPENDEDELEDEEEEEEIEGLNSSMEDSNMKQISFETNDFNKIYEEAESQNSTNNAAQEPKTEIPASSAQWRIAPINVNRPQGAAPLVPMDAPRDLMNLDANSIVNLNVAEVAKNAMMLLSTFVHNGDVQQQLSHLQNTTIGPANEPNGVDMNIRPQTTEFRMYHRFK